MGMWRIVVWGFYWFVVMCFYVWVLFVLFIVVYLRYLSFVSVVFIVVLSGVIGLWLSIVVMCVLFIWIGLCYR